MSRIQHIIIPLAAVLYLSTSNYARAQGAWSSSAYTPTLPCYCNSTTGTGVGTTQSCNSCEGILGATAGGSTSTSAGTAKVHIIYSVTFTWMGGGAPNTLTRTPWMDANIQVNPGCCGTATGDSLISTIYFGGYTNTTTAPPGFAGAKHGTATGVNPASPVTYLITGEAYANYAGVANTETSTKVYFK